MSSIRIQIIKIENHFRIIFRLNIQIKLSHLIFRIQIKYD
jgi:hypothetical protein